METLRRNRVLAGSPEEPWVNAYKLLRTRVLHRLREMDNANTLAITSPTPGAGKSLTSVNLALSIAMEVNKTVLLVDADLRRPSIHSYLGLKPKYGLSDYLTRGVPTHATSSTIFPPCWRWPMFWRLHPMSMRRC